MMLCPPQALQIDRHVLFWQTRKLEGHVDAIRVLVVMHVHPVCDPEVVVSCVVELGGLPWPGRV
jgi:hypothetical protein